MIHKTDILLLQTRQEKKTEHILCVFFRMLTDFTQEVAKLRDLPSGSPVVKYIHDYIYNHLDEKLSPHFFAEKLRAGGRAVHIGVNTIGAARFEVVGIWEFF